jgi:hypothetical protein
MNIHVPLKKRHFLTSSTTISFYAEGITSVELADYNLLFFFFPFKYPLRHNPVVKCRSHSVILVLVE